MNRWKLTNPSDLTDHYSFPRNPTQMGSPFPMKQFDLAGVRAVRSAGNYTNSGWDGPNQPDINAVERLPAPAQFSFTGVTISQQHYTDLLSWFERPGRLFLEDHFLRTWEVQIVSAEFVSRNTIRPWRLDYTVNAFIYSRIS